MEVVISSETSETISRRSDTSEKTESSSTPLWKLNISVGYACFVFNRRPILISAGTQIIVIPIVSFLSPFLQGSNHNYFTTTLFFKTVSKNYWQGYPTTRRSTIRNTGNVETTNKQINVCDDIEANITSAQFVLTHSNKTTRCKHAASLIRMLCSSWLSYFNAAIWLSR